MIIYNGKKLDTSEKSDPFVKLYLSQIRELEARKQKYFTFTHPDKKRRITEEGIEETSSGALIPFRQRYLAPTGDEYDIIFYRSSFRDKNGNENFRPRYYDFKGTTYYELDKEKELIWWLIYVCPNMEQIKGMEHKFNKIRGTVFYKLVDRKRESELEFMTFEQATKVHNWIYDRENGLPMPVLMRAAKALGLHKVDEMSEKQLRVELGAKVLRTGPDGKYNLMNLDKFAQLIADSDGGEFLKSRAVWEDAKAMDIVQYKDKGTTQDICVRGAGTIATWTPGGDEPLDNIVVTTLTQKRERRDKLEEVIKKVKEESTVSTVED